MRLKKLLKRLLRWGLGGVAALLLLLVGVFLLYPPQKNHCVAVSETAGLWLAFIHHYYVPILVPLSAKQIEADGPEELYYVKKEYMEAVAPQLRPFIIGYFSLSGMIYPQDEFDTYGESYFDAFGFRFKGRSPDNTPTYVDDHGLMWFGEGLFDDSRWTYGYVFSRYSNPIDWRTYLGRCPTARDPLAKPGLAPYFYDCEFKFYWKGLKIEYYIHANMAHRYREMEDFLKQHVICEITEKPKPR